MSNTSVEVLGEGLGSVKDFFVNNWKKILAGAMVAGGLALAVPKALANDYNPSHHQEPVQAGQVMKDDTTYVHYELIGDTNSGFEYPEDVMDWVKNDSNVGGGGINLHSKLHPDWDILPFDGEYSADMWLRGSGNFLDGYFEIGLSPEDTLKLSEFDSLNVALRRYQDMLYSKDWNLRIDLIGEKGEVMDTITLAYGQEEENTEHRFFKNLVNEDTIPYHAWNQKVFSKELKELINNYNLTEHKIKNTRFYLFAMTDGSRSNVLFIDNVEAHFTRQIITGVAETPTGRTPELTDVLLDPSNLYQVTFPQRGTLTIYEASTGRRVQAPIQVYGHVDVDFSGFPAGVYFGVYKPHEGRQQVVKIIKTQ